MNSVVHLKRAIKISAKVFMFLMFFVIVVFTLSYIYLKTNSGKRYVTNKVQTFLTKKLKTNFRIGSVEYHLPNEIRLSNIYLPSPNNDSLLFAGELIVNIALFKLIKGETDIMNIEIKNANVHILRNVNDNNYNFQFILDAFANNPMREPSAEVTAELKLNLRRIVLNNVFIQFTDNYAGRSMHASINSFESKMKTFKPDKLKFDIKSLLVDGITFKSMITKHVEIEKNTPQSTIFLLLDAQNVNLRNIKVEMSDVTNGFHYGNHIQHVAIDKARVSLINNSVELNKVILSNSIIEITTAPTIETKAINNTSMNMPWIVKLNEINLLNNSFKMNNGKPRMNGFDLNNINATNISLHSKDIFYTKDSVHALVENMQVKDHSGLGIDTLHANFTFTLHQIEATELYIKTPRSIIQNSLQLSFDSLKTLAFHPEKSHITLTLTNSIIDFEDVFLLLPALNKNALLANMQHEIISINTEVNGTLKQLNIPLLELVSLNGTTLHANAILTNVTDTKKLSFDLHILPSRILRSDLSKFVTLEKRDFEKLPAEFILQGNAKGSSNNFVAQVQLHGKNLLVHSNAKVLHMSNPKKLQYDVRIYEINIQKNLIMAFIPRNKFPQNIDLPSTIQLKGTAIGDLNNIKTNLQLDGSYGKISVNGFLKNFNQPSQAIYDLHIATYNFLIGKLTKHDTLLDGITMRTKIKGRGFGVNDMVSSIQSEIEQIGIKHYNYKSIHMNANLAKGALQSNGTVNDPNLKMSYVANSNSITKPTTLNLILTLDTARLHELNLIQDSIDISTSIQLTIENLAMDNLHASLIVDSVNVTKNNKKMNLDNILINAYKENENQILTVQSPILVMNTKGNFDYDKFASAVINFINRYYHVFDKQLSISNLQQIAIEGKVYEHPLIFNFVPKLTKFDSISFIGNFNSLATDSALNFSIQAPDIIYNSNRINKAAINMMATTNQLRLIASADSVNTTQANLLYTTVKATISHDSLDMDISTKNQNGNDRYALGAFMSGRNKTFIVQLKNNLTLNNQKWIVPPSNKFYYSPNGFYFSDFILTNNQSILNIQSEQNHEKSPIHVEIKNFSVSNITAMFNKDTLLASGKINGIFKVDNFNENLPSFEGILQVEELYLQQHKVGNLFLNTYKMNDNTIHANIKLSENDNDINIDGKYFLNNTQKQLEADVTINKFNMATMEGFSKGNITQASGSLDGNIQVKGKFSEPIWNGKINFKNPTFHLSKLGTTYTITNQTIILNHPNIELNKFTIADSLNHHLILDGSISSKSLSDYVLNMDVNAKDFIIVNTPQSTNEFIYGYAGINSNLNIKGNMTSPTIQGALSLNDATDATIILQQQSENKEKGKSVVRFIDRDTFALPESNLFATKDSIKNNANSILNYNVNVDLSNKAQLTVIIDPATGDQLKVSGDAKFNVGVDPGGNILLVGNYDLVKGHYILHYQFLKKQFDLLPHSTILFSGNPLDAQLDIRAAYTAKTSAIDLVGNELGDADSKTVNTFNQKISFKVLLFIKGTLKNLDISFDIKMPDENSGLSNTIVTTVENKLIQLRADPSAINKQVFSLLVLNRFVGEQSSDFFKGNGGGLEDIARESVSKFLSAALDQIASDLVKGVDIDLNLNSYKDYSSGAEQQRTDLNVGITKRFMNDRLSISLGKDFGVEGDDKSGKIRGSTNASYLPNAIVNYKLSKDGRYAIRVYSKNKFEVILDGYVVESGLSFIVTMDYEKFGELFGKKLQTN